MSLPEPVTGSPAPGSLAEIREQPAALRRLLEQSARVPRGRRAARADGLVRMVGHGSSDNAASYGVYAFGLLPGPTAMRDSISLTVYYGAKLDLSRLDRDRALAVGPHARRARVRDAGAARRAPSRSRSRTTPSRSSRARPTRVLPLAAGAEHAVAATKTYLEHARGARAVRRRSSAGRGDEFADGLECGRRRARAAAAAARAGGGVDRRPVRLGRPHVRDRPRPRVRDRARDRAEAARDLPDRRRAADRDRPRARPGRRARPALPGLGGRRPTTRRSTSSSRQPRGSARRARR